MAYYPITVSYTKGDNTHGIFIPDILMEKTGSSFIITHDS